MITGCVSQTEAAELPQTVVREPKFKQKASQGFWSTVTEFWSKIKQVAGKEYWFGVDSKQVTKLQSSPEP